MAINVNERNKHRAFLGGSAKQISVLKVIINTNVEKIWAGKMEKQAQVIPQRSRPGNGDFGLKKMFYKEKS